MKTTKILLVLFVFLTVIFATISTMEYFQSNDLKTSGRNLCKTLNSIVNAVSPFLYSAAAILNAQIQNDGSMISLLNSNKPVGYANMTSTLNTQIEQDTSILQAITSLSSSDMADLNRLSPSPCAVSNAP